jgi:hypothetical protein
MSDDEVEPVPVEREPTERLFGKFHAAIREHCDERPKARATAMEVLNALAMATALVLVGCGNDPDVRDFFDCAVDDNVIVNSD